ncbi:cation:proton antiporter [soil metagenome]
MSAQLLVVMAAGLIVTVVLRRSGFQANLIVLVVAAAVSFIPGVPRFELDPDIILSIVIPPLLYSTALNFSFTTFVRNFRAIVGLGVTLVLGTALVAGFVTGWLLPSIGAAAFVIGAVVSPPDTVTAVSHGKSMGFPRRVIAIITGESLVNDAAALTIFAVALTAAGGGSSFIASPVLLFGYEVVVGLFIGFVLAFIVGNIRGRLTNPTLATALNVIVPFAAYLVAEQVHASGVLAVVMAGFFVGTGSVYTRTDDPRTVGHRIRIQEAAVWPVIELMLEIFVFAYIGLQVRFVFGDLVSSGAHVGSIVVAGIVLLLLVIIVRPIGVFLLFGSWLLRERLARRGLTDPRMRERLEERQRRHEQRLEKRRARNRKRSREGRPEREVPLVPLRALGWKELILVSWTGMRGIVTLTAAAGVPLLTSSGAPFPGRDAIQAIALIVALGTLLIQGFTVPMVARALRIDSTEEEHADAVQLEKALSAAEGAGIELDPDSPDRFHVARRAVTLAMVKGEFDDETAREVIRRLDLRQAAVEAQD